MKIENDIISQFIEWREKLKVSQRELSKLSGVPQKTISLIENRENSPTLTTMMKLLKPLNLELTITTS